jgi:archaellum component FlaC
MNTELLMQRIKEKKISKSLIADEMNLTRQSLYNKLSGEREFVGSEIKKLAEILELSDNDKNDIFFTN